MTTKGQIKRLVKPLLARHDDLLLVGDLIVHKPVHHVLRAVLIDRTGEAARFRPHWSVMNLVEPREIFSLNFSERFYHPALPLWRWDDPKVMEAFIEAVEGEALPLLRPIQTLDDFVTLTCDRKRFQLGPFDAFPLKKIIVDVARGDIESARAIYDQIPSNAEEEWEPYWQNQLRRVRIIGSLLAAEDWAGSARQLHEWEAFTVKSLKLESVWERTPFPLELQKGLAI